MYKYTPFRYFYINIVIYVYGEPLNLFHALADVFYNYISVIKVMWNVSTLFCTCFENMNDAVPILTAAGILSIYSCCRLLDFSCYACSDKPYCIKNKASFWCKSWKEWLKEGAFIFTHHCVSSEKNLICIRKITGLSIICLMQRLPS